MSLGHSGQGENGPGDGHGATVGGSCGDLPGALATLVDQVATVKAGLAGAVERVRWTGPAALAFQDHATARFGTLAELLQELSNAAAASHSLQCLVGEGAA